MRYFSLSVLVLLVLSLAAMPRSARALEPPEPKRDLCRDIVATVNEVADFTETLCLPAHDPEGMSLVLISSQPVFAIESAKRAWLVTSVGANRRAKAHSTARSIMIGYFRRCVTIPTEAGPV
jgi:hypothetical protein